MKLRFEPFAEQAIHDIMQNDQKLGFKILARFKMLEVYPFIHYFGEYTIDSDTIEFLKKEKYDIKRLRCSEFDFIRTFYFVDDINEVVIVCEIMRRDENTYNPDAPHIERIKKTYAKYFKR